MQVEFLTAFFLWASMVLYLFLGGSDFGMGIVEVLFIKKRKEIEGISKRVIGPIWEANHVWLIIAIVISFVGFPGFFYEMVVTYHVALFLMLIGITIRGTAFTFRHYDIQKDFSIVIHRLFFEASSVVTLVVIGVFLTAMLQPVMVSLDSFWDYVVCWISPFSLLGGSVITICCVFNITALLAIEPKANVSEDMKVLFIRLNRYVGGLTIVGFGMLVGARGLVDRMNPYDERIWYVCGAIAIVMWGTMMVGVAKQSRLLVWGGGLAGMSAFFSGYFVAQHPILMTVSQTVVTITNSHSESAALVVLNSSILCGLVIVLPMCVYLLWFFKKEG